MTITVTQAHNESRLAATLARLDTGAGNAKVQIFEGARPVAAGGAHSATMLVEIELTKPAGTISNGSLEITQLEDGLIQNSGIATWGRFVNGNGGAEFDCDVDNGSNNGEISMATTQLYAGGDAKLVSCILG